MQILRYWKTVPIMGGITFDLVPVQEVTSDQGMFERILAAVREAKYLDFILIERTEMCADYRGPDSPPLPETYK